MVETIMRRPTLGADHSAFASVLLSTPGPLTRLSLRGSDTMAAALAAIGVSLPPRINQSDGEAISVLRLGPDEYLVVAHEGESDPEARSDDLRRRMAAALGGQPHALVDVSHRQTAIDLSGWRSSDVLSCFVPLDLDLESYPVGMATRTIFEKMEIVLWRRGADAFRVEVWRSFAPYVLNLLDAARREHE